MGFPEHLHLVNQHVRLLGNSVCPLVRSCNKSYEKVVVGMNLQVWALFSGAQLLQAEAG